MKRATATQQEMPFVNPHATRADQIVAAFEKFHAANPLVFVLFEQVAFEMVGKGYEHYAAQGIFEDIRWHSSLKTVGGRLKLNNNFGPYYARLFEDTHPAYRGFFNCRVLSTEHKPACDPDVQEFIAPKDFSGMKSRKKRRKK